MNQNTTTFLLAVLFFSTLSFLSAQNTPQWVNCTSGLHVNDVVETDQTFWIATTGGFIKQDRASGVQTFFNRGNSPVPSNEVTDLIIDQEGKLWGSTSLGTFNYDGENWQFFYDKSGILNLDFQQQLVLAERDSLHWWQGDTFTSIGIDNPYELVLSDVKCHPQKEEIWMTYRTYADFKVLRYDGQQWTIYETENSILPFESASNNPLLIDSQDNIWLGTDYGLYRFANEEWFFFNPVSTVFPEGAVYALGQQSSGEVLISLDQRGGINAPFTSLIVVLKPDDTWDVYPLSTQIKGNSRLNILHGTIDGGLLAGTIQDGLWAFDFQEWNNWPTSQSLLQSNYVGQILNGKDKTWLLSGLGITFENNSLISFEDGNWHTFQNTELPSGVYTLGTHARLLSESPDGQLWFHDHNQLYTYQNKNWSIPVLPDISSNLSEDQSIIHFTPSGNRWLMEEDPESSIFQETAEGWVSHSAEDHGSLNGYYYNFLNHPSTGDFWFSSDKGISHFDGQQWHLYVPKDLGFKHNVIYDMVVDKNNILWATTIKGLIRYDGDAFTIFTPETLPLLQRNPRSLAVDKHNRLWLGLESALACLEGKDWTLYTTRNSGIPNGGNRSLSFDDKGNLWIGSNSGGLGIYHSSGVDLDLTQVLHSPINKPEYLPYKVLSVYPNPLPNNSALNLELSDDFKSGENIQITLFNAQGQNIWTRQQTLTNYHICLADPSFDLASGVYYLQVRTANATASAAVYLR